MSYLRREITMQSNNNLRQAGVTPQHEGSDVASRTFAPNRPGYPASQFFTRLLHPSQQPGSIPTSSLPRQEGASGSAPNPAVVKIGRAKSALNEWCQTHYKALPRYWSTQTGVDPPSFESYVEADGANGRGTAHTKADAEEAAADQCLAALLVRAAPARPPRSVPVPEPTPTVHTFAPDTNYDVGYGGLSATLIPATVSKYSWSNRNIEFVFEVISYAHRPSPVAIMYRFGTPIGVGSAHDSIVSCLFAAAMARQSGAGGLELPSAQDIIGMLGAGASKGDGPGVATTLTYADVQTTTSLQFQQEFKAPVPPGLYNVEIDAVLNVEAFGSHAIAVFKGADGFMEADTNFTGPTDSKSQFLETFSCGAQSANVATTDIIVQTGKAKYITVTAGDVLYYNSVGGTWIVTIKLRTIEPNPGPANFPPLRSWEDDAEAHDFSALHGLEGMSARDAAAASDPAMQGDSSDDLAEWYAIVRDKHSRLKPRAWTCAVDVLVHSVLYAAPSDERQGVRRKAPSVAEEARNLAQRKGVPQRQARAEILEKKREAREKRRAEEEQAWDEICKALPAEVDLEHMPILLLNSAADPAPIRDRIKCSKRAAPLLDAWLDNSTFGHLAEHMGGDPDVRYLEEDWAPVWHCGVADLISARSLWVQKAWNKLMHALNGNSPDAYICLTTAGNVVLCCSDPTCGRARALLCQAFGHDGYARYMQQVRNRAAHALNGNTALVDAAAQAMVASSPAGGVSGASGAAVPQPSASDAMGKFAKALADAIWRDNLDLSPYVANRDAALTQWAQAHRPQPSSYQSTGEQSYGSFYENWSGYAVVITAGRVWNLQECWSAVSLAANINIPMTFGQAAGALDAALTTADAVVASQYIRINSSVTSGDAMQRALLGEGQKYRAKLCGSMSSVLTRLLLYVASDMPFLGPECASCCGNTQVLLQGPPAARLAQGDYWPLSPDHHVVGPPPNINARVITMNEMTAIRAGTYTTPIPAGWEVSTWGVSTAVVPILTDAVNRSQMLSFWTLAHMEYPFQEVQFGATYSNDDGITSIHNDFVRGKANMSRVPGPTEQVLYVLCNAFQTAGNIQIQVGHVAPIAVVWPTNNFSGAMAVDIFPAIDADWDSPGGAVALAGYVQAIEYWDQKYGNVEDMGTAFLVAADQSFVLFPGPRRVSSTVVNTGISYGVADLVTPTTWNTLGMVQPVAADAQNIAASAMGPLSASYTQNLPTVQNLRRPAVALGQFDSIAAADMAWGLIQPLNRTLGRVPRNAAQIMLRLRCIARIQSMLLDYIFSARGYGMEELLDGNVVAANNLTAEIARTWVWAYDVVNSVLMSAVPGLTARYLGAAMGGLGKPSYQGLVGCTTAWGRVPKHQAPALGLPFHVPQEYELTPLGKYSTQVGYPGVGNLAAVFTERTTTPDTDLAAAYAAISHSAVVSPLTRQDLQFAIATGPLASLLNIEFPAMYPSVGTAPGHAMLNFGPMAIDAMQNIDLPIQSLPPKRTARDGQNKYFVVYGALIMYFRSKMKYFNMRIPQLSAEPDRTQLASDEQPTDPMGVEALLSKQVGLRDPGVATGGGVDPAANAK